MEWWQQLLMTAATVSVTLIITNLVNNALNIPKKKRQEEELEAKNVKLCMRGIQVLLKNELKVRYDHWLDLGYAPEDAKDDLEREYQVYHSMGKNGVMDSRREKFLRLPNEPTDQGGN